MTRLGPGSASSSDQADLAKMLRRASRSGVFDSLVRIYEEFPETTCENCARCCFESPGIFFTEYLHLVDLLAKVTGRRGSTFMSRAFRELLFSWIEPGRTCIFLESSHCVIYDHRPLACRLFGLVPPKDRDRAEAEARLAARQEAQRLRLFGVDIPEEVIQRSLVSCDRVRDAKGRPARVDGDAIAARVAHLDTALLPQEVVLQEFCFRSLPERLGAAALGGQAVEGMRVQLLRRAQGGERIADLTALVLKQARLPTPLRRKGCTRG